jgi:hypothetical protein
MSFIIAPPPSQIVAPVSDRRYGAPPIQHRRTVTTCAAPAGHAAAPRPLLRIRLRAENPDHHLWNNHGTWFLHYTVHPTPFTKERVRRSLGTPDLATARERRDVFFAHWENHLRSAAAA